MSVVLALLAAAASGRESLGLWSAWGAFRDASPRRCYAIARPVRAAGREVSQAFASVGSWPAHGRRGVVFIRLSTPRDEGEAVTLSVGERRFRLAGRGAAAWSPDPATDRALVSAIRGERSMSVEAVSAGGRAFADIYVLGGAATAIDAATLGCLKQ